MISQHNASLPHGDDPAPRPELLRSVPDVHLRAVHERPELRGDLADDRCQPAEDFLALRGLPVAPQLGKLLECPGKVLGHLFGVARVLGLRGCSGAAVSRARHAAPARGAGSQRPGEIAGGVEECEHSVAVAGVQGPTAGTGGDGRTRRTRVLAKKPISRSASVRTRFAIGVPTVKSSRPDQRPTSAAKPASSVMNGVAPTSPPIAVRRAATSASRQNAATPPR